MKREGEQDGVWRFLVTRFFVAEPPQNDIWIEGEEGVRLEVEGF